jgi:hypothetical protein
MFDKLYFLNGTLYVVSDEPESIPNRRMMISTAADIENGPIGEAKRVPTDKEMRIVSTRTAKSLFGVGAERLDGVTVRFSPSFFHENKLRIRSGWPMTLLNCESICHDSANSLLTIGCKQVSLITITGLLNCSSASGERIRL